MSLALKCRLLPSKAKHKRLIELVEGQRLLYKAALEERIDCCRKTGKSPAHFDQTKALTECRRELSEMNGIPAQLQRGTLKRLDEACKQFYRRVKRGEKPSFPRFKGRGWFDTLEFAEFSGITFDGKHLRSKAFGSVRVDMHRRCKTTSSPARSSVTGETGMCASRPTSKRHQGRLSGPQNGRASAVGSASREVRPDRGGNPEREGAGAFAPCQGRPRRGLEHACRDADLQG